MRQQRRVPVGQRGRNNNNAWYGDRYDDFRDDQEDVKDLYEQQYGDQYEDGRYEEEEEPDYSRMYRSRQEQEAGYEPYDEQDREEENEDDTPQVFPDKNLGQGTGRRARRAFGSRRVQNGSSRRGFASMPPGRGKTHCPQRWTRIPRKKR